MPKISRPSTLGLHLSNGTSLRSEEDEERWLELISDNARLLGHFTQMREEMRMNQAWMRNVMQESREKDKKILELQAALSPGQPTSSNDSGTLSVAINPSSLGYKFAQANLIGSASRLDHFKFAKIGHRTSSNEDHMAEQGSVLGPLHRQTQSTHSLGSQSFSRMRPRGSLDSPSPISQDFH